MAHAEIRLPPLNGLRAFEAAARHLNFRLAAEELGVTQSAVAQQVRALEANLGFSLFERLSRSLALTDQGRRYASQLNRAFALMMEATAGLRSQPQTLGLTISVTPSFASKWLIPRLPEFTDAHPNIALRILASESLANFQSDGVDIAVRQARPPFGPGLVADLLFRQEIIAVCSPALVASRSAPLRPADLDGITLLNDAHDLWPEFIEQAAGSPPSASLRQVRFNQTALAIDAAVAGQGIALASRFLVERDIEAGRLVPVLQMAIATGTDIYVVAPRKPRQPAPAAMVRAWLLAQANEAPLAG